MAATTTTLVSSSPMLQAGATLTLTATVSGGTPTGNVQFKDGSATIATIALTAGVAVHTTAALSTGQHSLWARYVGDGDDAASSSPVVLQRIIAVSSGVTELKKRFATVFRHEQASASATWTIVHKLHDYPIIDVFVNYNGEIHKIIPSQVTYTDEDTVTISFTTPYSGFATVV
jgi:hypothetical protein